jgi:FkbM family methyltransferase
MAKNGEVYGNVVCMALSDTLGQSEIFISHSNIGGSSLEESELGWKRSGYSGKLTIHHEPFDRYFKTAIDDELAFDLVKIDVEGHEANVLRGMKRALDKKLVRRIWCEVRGDSSDRNPGSFRDVCGILEFAGYKAFTYHDDKKSGFDWRSVSTTPQYFDLLFELNS